MSTRLLVVAVLAALGVTGGALAELTPLTVERVFGSDDLEVRGPDDVLWLGNGNAFIYRQLIGGVDGLWHQEVATGRITLVADWSALARRLEVARPDSMGYSLDDVNTHPGSGDGPSISPDASTYLGTAHDDLFRLNLRGGEVSYLTSDRAKERFATFSPDGGRVAFARDGDLYVLDLESRRVTRVTNRGDAVALLNGVADWVYEEELDVRRSFWWSPGGDHIAYVQYDTSPVPAFPIVDSRGFEPRIELQRYPKAGDANARVRLGVVPAGGGATTWIDTGGMADAYIARVGWVPGGKELWFQVLSRSQQRLELRFADPGTGSSRLVLAEEDPSWINVRDDMIFVDQRTFVWSSERDGWRHLYLYGTDGRLIRRLTEGSWQVEEVLGLDAAHAAVLFMGTALDPRERHPFRVGLDGQGMRCLLPEPGTHSVSLSPDRLHLLDTFSSLETPTRVDLCTVGGTLVRTVSDGVIPALAPLQLQAPELGSLQTEDGATLYWSMFRPPRMEPGKRYPALVYVYGGPGAQIVTNQWDGRRRLFYELLAREGLIVFALDNRGSWGRGHAFETAIHRRLGEVELADQLAGVDFLKGLPFVDGERIGVYGGSYGGYMTLLCMNRAPEAFAAGIAYAPVADWRLYDTIYTERYMGTPADNPDGYEMSAPLTHAAGLAGRLLLCHGLVDNNVHLQNSIQMVEAYARADKLVEVMLYPASRHLIRTSSYKLQFHKLKLDFLRRYLIKDGPR